MERVTNVWNAIRTKRTVRRFEDRPLDAGAPRRGSSTRAGAPHSSKNQQRWDFIVVEDRATLAALATLGPSRATSRARPPRSRSSRPIRRAPGARSRVVWDARRAAAQ